MLDYVEFLLEIIYSKTHQYRKPTTANLMLCGVTPRKQNTHELLMVIL